MAEPVTIKLRTPIQFGSQTISEMTFRPLTGKALRRLPVEEAYRLETVLVLASRLSGQPDGVIDLLEGDDLVEVMKVASGFLEASQGTGKMPSPP